MAEPTSFRDPQIASLAAGVEQKLDLPTGLLRTIITDGERSNGDQVSSAGARTVAQIIPATRRAAIDKYGIDAYLSTPNALEVAGRLLKDSLDRSKGDVETAVRQYHGGIDKANWGKVNDAYWGRVSKGLQRTQLADLGSKFGEWMAANPANPPAATPPPVAAQPDTKFDQLSAGFGAFLQAQQPVESKVAQIPGQDGNPVPTPAPAAADPSLVQRALGVGEAALATGSGLLAAPIGAAAGVMGALADGNVRDVYPAMQRGAQALTYAPRTAAGQDYTQAVAAGMQEALPLAPLAGEAALLRKATGNAAQPAAAAIRAAPAAVADAVKAAPAAVSRAAGAVIPGRAAERLPTAGTMASGGAAGVDIAAMRRARADELPVPIKLTEGQATREQGQVQFERETAKDGAAGTPLRQHFDNQNKQIDQNFDALIDQTGAEAPNNLEAGRVLTEAVRKDAARAKTEYRVKYREAEKAGEMEEPVSTAPLIDYIKENESFDSPGLAPVLSLARKELLRLGGAVDEGGALVARDIPLKQAELLRRQIGAAIGADPANATNMRVGVQLKNLIDETTDGLGGRAYQQARKARQRYAQLYENNNIVSQLLESKRGSSDRQVALENVFNKTILNGSREDLSMLRRTLHVADSPEGRQAWRELQGATVRHIQEQASGGVGMDGSGNAVVSPAKLHAAVKALDKGEKLQFILGKKGAETIRTIDDVARTVFTTPAGSVNHSNTSAALIAWMTEAGLTGAATGLPLPVISTINLISRQVKDARLRRRIQESLGNRATPTPAPQPRTVH